MAERNESSDGFVRMDKDLRGKFLSFKDDEDKSVLCLDFLSTLDSNIENYEVIFLNFISLYFSDRIEAHDFSREVCDLALKSRDFLLEGNVNINPLVAKSLVFDLLMIFSEVSDLESVSLLVNYSRELRNLLSSGDNMDSALFQLDYILSRVLADDDNFLDNCDKNLVRLETFFQAKIEQLSRFGYEDFVGYIKKKIALLFEIYESDVDDLLKDEWYAFLLLKEGRLEQSLQMYEDTKIPYHPALVRLQMLERDIDNEGELESKRHVFLENLAVIQHRIYGDIFNRVWEKRSDDVEVDGDSVVANVEAHIAIDVSVSASVDPRPVQKKLDIASPMKELLDRVENLSQKLYGIENGDGLKEAQAAFYVYEAESQKEPFEKISEFSGNISLDNLDDFSSVLSEQGLEGDVFLYSSGDQGLDKKLVDLSEEAMKEGYPVDGKNIILGENKDGTAYHKVMAIPIEDDQVLLYAPKDRITPLQERVLVSSLYSFFDLSVIQDLDLDLVDSYDIKTLCTDFDSNDTDVWNPIYLVPGYSDPMNLPTATMLLVRDTLGIEKDWPEVLMTLNRTGRGGHTSSYREKKVGENVYRELLASSKLQPASEDSDKNSPLYRDMGILDKVDEDNFIDALKRFSDDTGFIIDIDTLSGNTKLEKFENFLSMLDDRKGCNEWIQNTYSFGAGRASLSSVGEHLKDTTSANLSSGKCFSLIICDGGDSELDLAILRGLEEAGKCEFLHAIIPEDTKYSETENIGMFFVDNKVAFGAANKIDEKDRLRIVMTAVKGRKKRTD